jgi:hypothetical protein
VTALLGSSTARNGGPSGLGQCLVVSCVAGVGMAKLRQLLPSAPWVCRTVVELGALTAEALQPQGPFPHLIRDRASNDAEENQATHDATDRYGDRSAKGWDWPGDLGRLPSRAGSSSSATVGLSSSAGAAAPALAAATAIFAAERVLPPSPALLREAARMLAGHALAAQAATEGAFVGAGLGAAEARHASLVVALGYTATDCGGDLEGLATGAHLGLPPVRAASDDAAATRRGDSHRMQPRQSEHAADLWADDDGGGGAFEDERRADAHAAVVAECAAVQAARVLPHFHAAFARTLRMA